MYNVVMFAYNEAQNIAQSIQSIYKTTNEQLNTFYIIVNGTTDNTIVVANDEIEKLGFSKCQIIEIELGDKCNAWNQYVHQLADVNVDVHFFVDADVKFSDNCFDVLHKALLNTSEETVLVAGMPLSGRNLDFYRSLVIERSCFFGNLYGIKTQFIQKLRDTSFHLPIGLNWIDSFLTKLVNTDITFERENKPNRTTYHEGTGYFFDSLSPFKPSDIKLYINRIARYELGKLQEIYLDKIKVQDWPQNMQDINIKIYENFESDTKSLSFIKTYLVKKRLNKMISKVESSRK